jgi:hypothetical protein
MFSKTLIKAPVETRSFDLSPMLDSIKKLVREILMGRQPLDLYPGEIDATLQYHQRLTRMRTPDPYEGEVLNHARKCFFLRYYSGEREIFSANTETQELVRLSFLASYRGQREIYFNLEIGSPR